MKKIYLFSMLCLTGLFAFAQVICNSAGNLMIYTNYDGGVLNIDVDIDIPDLKIGVVTYEGTTINLSGAFVNNVKAVSYAGFNGSNAHCGSIINTSINGAPAGATTSITFAPQATLSNPNGNQNIICGYSCSINTNQGGCNTIDQIEDYFLNFFPGSVLYAHKVQYGCWNGTQLLSTGGTCCGLITNLLNINPESTFLIYPNPSGDKLYMQSSGKIKSYKCFNQLGQAVDLTLENCSFDISALPQGMYMLILDTDSGVTLMKKFIKE